MKAKQTLIAQSIAPVTPRSMKDAGYQTAQIGESSRAIAQYVLEQCPDFVEQCPDEVKAELVAGFQLRAYELWGAKTYRTGDTGALIESPDGNISIDVNVAMAYTGQAFGKLKEENPALHGLIGPMRAKFQKYASEKMSDLRSACKKILNAGKTRERAANKDFLDAVKAAFDALDKRVKTAQSRGDSTADPVKYRMAVDAFWKTLK